VPDLHAFRHAIAALSANPEPAPRPFESLRVASSQVERRQARGALSESKGGTTNPEPAVVVVPTRSAGHQLRQRLDGALVVTRDGLYDLLHARLVTPPRRLGPIERDVLAQTAARTVAAAGEDLSFRLRPGLVGEVLRFYDQLRRQPQQVTRFEELLGDALGSDEDDRAAVRMRRQTRFLSDTFREYERRLRESGGCDEHVLREHLVTEAAVNPVRHVIVSVADWIAEAEGLYAADFDLLTRLPGLESLDLVCTEAVLGSGFHERLHTWWPGLEEVDGASIQAEPNVARVSMPAVKPALMTPPGAPPDEPWWTFRDREEELVAIARMLKAVRRTGDDVPLSRIAVVYKTPLPYLYLAPEVLRPAGIPFQTTDALPLAAEPVAAALDLLLHAASAKFTRGALVALLRSPHFAFPSSPPGDGDDEVTRESVSALDRALGDARYLGDLDRLRELAAGWQIQAAAPALRAALGAGRDLAPLLAPRPASEQVRCVLAFWSAHVRPLEDADPYASRERRARAAIVEALRALADARAAYDDLNWTIEDVGLAVRRAIEELTFTPESAAGGVHLVDDQAARYGEFDDIAIVGMVEADWPERPKRNIFYPPSLLKSLGWPSENDRRGAADARFLDLLASSSRRTLLSTFTLDEDAIVSRSVQLDQVPRARLSAVARTPFENARIFADEALSLDPPAFGPLDVDARAWAELRMSRSSCDRPEFHGTVAGEPASARAWSVSALETYLGCPFKFFAQHVLKLEEEPDDEEVMDPRRQGQFVHEVFERFFAAWQAAGYRAVTPDNLNAARDMFAAIVDRTLERLPVAEAGLERTRLLGSPVAGGLGEAALRMEAERPIPVVERLLEHRLAGDFTIATGEGPRTIALKGKADRLDLLADGTFRLIDYKLGRPPSRATAFQLPIYSVCAEQRLMSYRGRAWTLGEAAYLAFKGTRRVVPLFSSPADRSKVLAEAQQRLADTVDAISRGEFPPTPDGVFRCERCSFAPVCRKDYVGDV
jgi:RecB family exonuclease